LDKDNLGGIYRAGKVTLERNNSVPKQSDIAKQLGVDLLWCIFFGRINVD